MNDHDRAADGEDQFESGKPEELLAELAADHLLPASEHQQSLEANNTRWLFYFLAVSFMWSVGSDLPVGESSRVGEAEGDSTGSNLSKGEKSR